MLHLFALVSLAGGTPLPPAPLAEVDFQRDIRPILSDNCFACHGPDAADRAAGLRLDLREEAIRSLNSGRTAIAPRDPQGSELLRRVAAEDPAVHMPPPQTGKRLKPEEIELLRQWIEAGAEYSDHWSFVPPTRVNDLDPGSGAIDQLVQRSYEEEQLEASPPADPVTLLRRVTLHLTGLPPTAEELAAFAADPSEEAYQAALDRLFASPRYGENMARDWLDAARYADTHGLHLDNERSHWLWREWVIDAFNEGMPFDQFTIWQLAGDLLPDATLEQRIASGFNRNHPTSAEGGMIAAEYLALYAKDRVDTTSTIWLGLTMGCAQCHDHKFDPLSQRDYYSLYAFFNSLTEEASDRNIPNPVPFLAVPSEEQEAERDRIDAELASYAAKIDAPMPEADAAQEAFEASWRAGAGPRWSELDPIAFSSEGGSTLSVEPGTTIVAASGENPDQDAYVIEAFTPRTHLHALRLDALCAEGAPRPGRAVNQNFVLSSVSVEARPADGSAEWQVVPLQGSYATFSQSDYGIETVLSGGNGWAGLGREGSRSALWTFERATGFSSGTHLRVRLGFETVHKQHAFARFQLFASDDQSLAPLEASDWQVSELFGTDQGRQALQESYPPETASGSAGATWTPRPEFRDGAVHRLMDTEPGAIYLKRELRLPEARQVLLGLGSDDGVRLWVDGELVHDNPAPRGVALDQDLVRLDLEPGLHELLLKVANYGGPGAFAFRVIEQDAEAPPIDLGLALTCGHPDDADRARRYFRSRHAPEWIRWNEERDQLNEKRTQLVADFPTVLVSEERMEPRPAYILMRGAYDAPGEEVLAATPAALPAMDEDAPRDRLGLAQWLVSREQPLTARVYVNRLWQSFFGTGLVKTAEDFGNQGEWPSHPELLDWLAVEFMESGWDIQHIQRLILSSRTYRQSSRASDELLARDPENRLLARGPRYRLPAEVIRDQALWMAGLLVEELGGPSVRPWQPAGLWKAVGYTSSNTAIFKADEGEDLYRRSLYTFWKRTSPPPNLQTFDAPTREACVVRRSLTNTPLQALVLMNDPQFVEAARELALRIVHEGGAEDRDRLAWGFELATSRPMDSEERELTLKWLQEEQARITSKEAQLLLQRAEGDLEMPEEEQKRCAVYVLFASLLLNLDETITLR